MKTEEQTTDIIVIEQPELVALKRETSLSDSKADQILFKYSEFLPMISEIKRLSSKIDREYPTDLDCKIAGDLRKRLVKIRTAAEEVKDRGKAQILIEGRLEDSANGLIKNSCKLLESEFEQIEKAAEIREKKRKSDLKIARTEILLQYISNPEIYPLGEMNEDSFNDLVEGFNLAKEKKMAEEKRIAEELIAKEKADREEREKQRLENEHLKKEADEREKVLAIEREKAAKEKAIADSKLKAEYEKAAKLKAESDAKAEKEKQIAAKKLKDEQDRNEALLKVEREKVAKLKDEADAKAKKEAEELRVKQLAEKKAASATDKVKLEALITTIRAIELPSVKSQDAIRVVKNTQDLLIKVCNYLIEQIKII